MSDNIQYYILNGLLTIEDYIAKYIEKLEVNHFSVEMQPIIKGIQKFYLKNLKAPSIAILIDRVLPKMVKNDQDLLQTCEDIVQSAMVLEYKKNDFYDWLKEETNDFIKKERVKEALVKVVDIVNKGNIDDAKRIMDEAYQISFDDSLGLDYFGHLKERMKRLKESEDVIDTGLPTLNNLIGGGWRNKTLTVFGAGTNVGKTLILSDISLRLIRQGLNGLYITLEIYEDGLANRIDANLANIPLSDLEDNVDFLMETIVKEEEDAKKNGKPFGRFMIKEYPSGINCNTILGVIRELKLKHGFKPDFLVVDYIGLMAPNGRALDNTFMDLKKVSVELRALAAMFKIPIFTAQQTNRDSYGEQEIGLESTSESMGIPFTADFMIMCSRTKEMEEENQMYWWLAKSRFSRNNVGFYVNVEYPYMRITENNVKVENVNVNKTKPDKKLVEVSYSFHTQNISGNSKQDVEEWTKKVRI